MLSVLLVLVLVGVGLYLLNQYVPMAPPFKMVINVVAVLFLILWMLQVFGLVHGGPVLRP